MHRVVWPDWKSLRTWGALAFLVAAYFFQAPLEKFAYTPLRHAADLHMFANGVMSLSAYGVLMLVRLLSNVLLVVALWAILGRPFDGFPVKDRRLVRHLAIGLGIGLVVMVAGILCIAAIGDAQISPASQTAASVVKHGGGWLLFDIVGAMGEELFGRAAVLLVAERFVGWKGAIVVSGLMFVTVHLGNPGASALWLLRLGLQGALLAYAVYRTQSLWWSVGYHAGWNWASAPLFGAAGSGYLDEGHVFDFVPRGSGWITGGIVGPEGSVFAFVAMLAAFALLGLTTERSEPLAAVRFASRELAQNRDVTKPGPGNG